MSFTKITAAVIVAAVLAVVSGCVSMADPDGTDLPWTQQEDWEKMPNLPSSMLQGY